MCPSSGLFLRVHLSLLGIAGLVSFQPVIAHVYTGEHTPGEDLASFIPPSAHPGHLCPQSPVCPFLFLHLWVRRGCTKPAEQIFPSALRFERQDCRGRWLLFPSGLAWPQELSPSSS